MARFVFKLNGVLRRREHVEQEKQRELAIVQAQMAALKSELCSLESAVQSNANDLKSNHLTGKLDMHFLAAHRRYSLAMQHKALALAQEMAAQKLRVEAAQKELVEAARQRKILEKLQERQHERWAAELSRREAADIDEIGMQLGAQVQAGKSA